MKKALIVITILMFAGCKKSPFQQTYDPGPLYAIPAEMKAWTIFKPGSYWVYKNENTGQHDSAIYKYGPYSEVKPCGNCPVIQYNWYFLTSPMIVKFRLIGQADSNAELEVTNRARWTFDHILTYQTIINPDTTSINIDYFLKYRCLGHFPTYSLNGNIFTNVIGARIEETLDTYYQEPYYVESFFARNIGLIKYHQHTNEGDTTWSLTSWHTVQ